jgi:hypothetical protein
MPFSPSTTNEKGRFAHIPFFKKTAVGKTFKTWVHSPDYGLDSNVFTVVVGQPPVAPPLELLPMIVGAGIPILFTLAVVAGSELVKR